MNPAVKRTDELQPGDRVLVPCGPIRTVARVEASGYRVARNAPLFNVMYAEGRTPEWGPGNSALADTPWTLE